MASPMDMGQSFRQNERLATLVNYGVASLMLVCVVVAILQQAAILAPGWNAGYLLPFCFILSLESMYTHRSLDRQTWLDPEWYLYRGTEWVVILVMLKLVMYLVNGLDGLLAEIRLWGRDFLNSFFNNEFLVVAGIAFVVWILANFFSRELAGLEGDEKLLAAERDSGVIVQRSAIRMNLINLIVILGGAITFMTALQSLVYQLRGPEAVAPPTSGWNVLAYFLLGLLLLSLTQFSILRARWGLASIPISAHLGRRWVTYSLVFLLALSLFVIVLPTRYSVGLLEILQIGLAFLIGFVNLLLLLFSLPLLLLLSLFGGLFGGSETLENFRPPVIPPPADPVGGSSWIELFKSLVFWVALVAITGLSFYYYLLQNRELAGRLRRVSFVNALVQFGGWLRGLLRGWRKTAGAALAAGMQRLRVRRNPEAGAGWGFVNLRRLSPRQRVIFFYLAMVRRGSERGSPRTPAQTPYEYSQALQANFPDVEEDVSGLTEQFVEARYSRHDITPERVGLVQRYWEKIRRALRKSLGRQGGQRKP